MDGRFVSLKCACVLGAVLAMGEVSRADWIAGRDLRADILGGTPTDPNGTVPQWSYGTETALGTGFTTATYTFTAALAGEPRLQGWLSAGTGNVPDATVNMTNTAFSPSFGPFDTPIQPGEMFVHPGGLAGNGPAFTVVRWTAPAAGQYDVTAHWTVINSNAMGIETALLLNDNAASPLLDSKNLTTAAAYPSTVLTLSAGDTLSFMVGPDSSNNNGSDHTAFDATISSVPEPASAALGVGGLLALALRRRRSA